MTSRREGFPDGDSEARQLAPLAPISPSELARLRRGELDADAVAALVERTVGLAAPAAPPEGDLFPNQSGWLVGAGEPSLMQLNRAPIKFLDRWSWIFLLPWFIAAEFSRSKLTVLVGLAPLILVVRGLTFPRGRLRRQLERASQVVRLDDVAEGTLVRVAGTIPPQATVPTLFRGLPAVLFRNRMGPADETRGLDFLLELDSGEQAKVAVRRGFLLEPPKRTREPPACGPVSFESVGQAYVLRSDMLRPPPLIPRLLGRYESSVGPGDRIEVCGIVRHVLAPDLPSRSPREAPSRHLLEAGDETPLLVRRPVAADD